MTAARILKLLLLVSLAGCSSQSAHLAYVKEIVDSFASEMKRDFDLALLGSGGSMPYSVEEIEVSLVAHRKGSIEEARVLEIEATERLLKKINEHQKIRPFLKEYPFLHDRACVSISFWQKNNIRFPDGISLVFQANKQIFYCKRDPGTKALVNQLVETYEEALSRRSVCR